MNIYRNNLFPTVIGCFLSVRNSIAGKIDRIQIGGIQVIPSSKAARLNIVFDGDINVHISNILPPSIQNYFSMLHLSSPQRGVIFTSLLQIYKFSETERLAQRLIVVCDYFLSLELLTEKMLTSVIVKAIKIVGENKLSNAIDQNKISWILYSQIIRLFPVTSRILVNDNIFKMLANIFLDVLVPDDEDCFQNKTKSKSVFSQIDDAVKFGVHSNLVLCGPVKGGKSTLLFQVCENINRQILHENAKILPFWMKSLGASFDSILRVEQVSRPLNLKVLLHGRTLLDLADLTYVTDYLKSFIGTLNKKRTAYIITIESFDVDVYLLLSSILVNLTKTISDVFYFVWECSDIDMLCLTPSTLQSCNLVVFDRPLYSLRELCTVFVSSFFLKFTPIQRENLIDIFLGIFSPCLSAVYDVNSSTLCIPLQSINIIQSGLKLVNALYYNAGIETRKLKPMLRDDISRSIIRDDATLQKIVLFACIWAIGGSLSDFHRAIFKEWFRSHIEKSAVDFEYFPNVEDPFGYYLVSDFRGHSQLMWKRWNADFIRLESQLDDVNVPFDNPTINNLAHAVLSPNFTAQTSLNWCVIPTRTIVGAQIVQSMLLKKGGQMVHYFAPFYFPLFLFKKKAT